MTTTPAEDIDVDVCVNGNTIDVSVEGGEQTVNVPWDGASFANANFTSFSPSGSGAAELFPDMTISGTLLSSTSMQITVDVENSGSTTFAIPFIGEIC